MNPNIEKHFSTFLWKVFLSEHVEETFNEGIAETQMPEKLSLLKYANHKLQTLGVNYFMQSIANEQFGLSKFHDGTEDNVIGHKLWTEWLGEKEKSLLAIQKTLPQTISFWEEQLKILPTISNDSERLANIEKALEKSVILQKEILTIEEAATHTSYSVSYLYKLTSSNKIPHYNPLGNKLFFRREELDKWMLSGRSKTIEEIEKEASTFLKSKKKR
ncbi:helix-turn-helix transcriptional regulator [Rufibacter roseus]|uniref:Helix-turn-helix transcriptional regulator n=1 Tax=Rufibacter roseus TaxID=1567108 RepID=A0ABW2DTW4_9BACT|nr:helix-turn-helix domain-containing protein [Rufibacter roseus]